MKAFFFTSLVILWAGAGTTIQPDNDLLVTIQYEGSEFEAIQLVKGEFSLFLSQQFEEKPVTGPLYRKTKKVLVKRYFLKFENQVEKITPFNYKKIIITHLANAPELHQRLGKPGFRYENTPSMIRFYNQYKLPEFIEQADDLLPSRKSDKNLFLKELETVSDNNPD